MHNSGGSRRLPGLDLTPISHCSHFCALAGLSQPPRRTAHALRKERKRNVSKEAAGDSRTKHSLLSTFANTRILHRQKWQIDNRRLIAIALRWPANKSKQQQLRRGCTCSHKFCERECSANTHEAGWNTVKDAAFTIILEE